MSISYASPCSATGVTSQMGERVELERSFGSNIRHWNVENVATLAMKQTHKIQQQLSSTGHISQRKIAPAVRDHNPWLVKRDSILVCYAIWNEQQFFLLSFHLSGDACEVRTHIVKMIKKLNITNAEQCRVVSC